MLVSVYDRLGAYQRQAHPDNAIISVIDLEEDKLISVLKLYISLIIYIYWSDPPRVVMI